MKNYIIIVLIWISLFINGCGQTDSKGENRLQTQQDLDAGNYQQVIDKLQSSAVTADDLLALSAAYMGRAGLSISSIINIVATDSNGSAFSGFVDNIAKKSTRSAITDLGKSSTNYKKVLGGQLCDNNSTLSDTQKDICLYIGLANATKSAVAISLLTNDTSVLSNTGTTDYKLKASTCAMQYVFDGLDESNIDAECQGNIIVSPRSVYFQESEKLYSPMSIVLNGEKFYFLITEAIQNIRQVAMTDGYCTNRSFSTRTIPDKNVSYNPPFGYYACPVNEEKGAKDITSIDTLVIVLNEGFSSIGGSASKDTQQDIDKFKQDIYDSNPNRNPGDYITADDIIKYLIEHNK